MRSRVTPGISATRASRVRVSALNRVDFPTLGRPTMTTTGTVGISQPQSAPVANLPGAQPAVLVKQVKRVASDQRRSGWRLIGGTIARHRFTVDAFISMQISF